MEKLVDIVLFLHMEIRSVFGSAGMCSVHVLGKSTFVLISLHVSLVSSKFYTIVYILFLIDKCTVVYITSSHIQKQLPRFADKDERLYECQSNEQRLGPAGLSLHYANIVLQIDTIVS